MFFQFLNKIFNGDQDLIDYLQKFFGYILTGLTTEHAMLFFHGAGANGKSVLVSTIAGILGEYHRVAPIVHRNRVLQTLDRFSRAYGRATRDRS
jgi:putative DNA primase/helicase